MSHEYTGSLCTSAATVHAHPWLQRPGWPGDVDVDKAQVSPGEGQRGCRADADGAPADLQAVTLMRLPHPPASQTRYSPAETRLTGQVHPPAYRPITKMPVSFRMLNCLTQSPLTTVQQGCMSVAATDCSRFLKQCLHMLSTKLLHAFPTPLITTHIASGTSVWLSSGELTSGSKRSSSHALFARLYHKLDVGKALG